MRLSNVDLKLLRLFVAVVEAGGFAAAQTRLGLSPSTISIHMGDLEGRLGYKLCVRGRGGFQLTERGQKVYDETIWMLRSLDDFNNKIHGLRYRMSGRLVIGIVDGTLFTEQTLLMSSVLSEFNKVDNDVELELIVEPTERLESMILNERVHAAIGPFIRPINGIKYERLYDEPNDVYSGIAHPLTVETSRQEVTDLLSHARIAIRDYNRNFELSQFKRNHEDAVVSSLEAMATLLLSEGYVGYLPVRYAQQWVEEGRLAVACSGILRYDSAHALITKNKAVEAEPLRYFASILRRKLQAV